MSEFGQWMVFAALLHVFALIYVGGSIASAAKAIDGIREEMRRSRRGEIHW